VPRKCKHRLYRPKQTGNLDGKLGKKKFRGDFQGKGPLLPHITRTFRLARGGAKRVKKKEEKRGGEKGWPSDGHEKRTNQ